MRRVASLFLPHLAVERLGHNVVARTSFGRDRRVLLAGHLDTVPIADNVPCRVEGERLYGCGSSDMKSGVAVMLRLAAGLASPAYDLSFVFYECEEIEAARNGLGRLARERRRRRRQAQGVGQFHDLDVRFRRRQGAHGVERVHVEPSGSPDLIGAGQGAQQRHEVRLRFHGEGAHPGAERREVAGELQRVTEAVVAADEHAAAVERAAVPDPTEMVGQRRVVRRGGIARGENGVAHGPGRREVAPAHGILPGRAGVAGRGEGRGHAGAPRSLGKRRRYRPDPGAPNNAAAIRRPVGGGAWVRTRDAAGQPGRAGQDRGGGGWI